MKQTYFVCYYQKGLVCLVNLFKVLLLQPKLRISFLPGTRIIYERKFLLDLKNSPLSKTPTKLPVIPGITLDDDGKIIEEDEEPSTNVMNKLNENQVPKEEQNGHDPKKNQGNFICSVFL